MAVKVENTELLPFVPGLCVGELFIGAPAPTVTVTLPPGVSGKAG
jgi:hypothetical protein